MSKLPCQFVTDSVSCVSAKYYLNWFTVGKVIAKIKRANFLSRHSVVVNIIIMPAIIVNCNVRNGKYVHCAETV